MARQFDWTAFGAELFEMALVSQDTTGSPTGGMRTAMASVDWEAELDDIRTASDFVELGRRFGQCLSVQTSITLAMLGLLEGVGFHRADVLAAVRQSYTDSTAWR